MIEADTFKILAEEECEVWKTHITCLSAKEGINIQELLKKIIDEDFYKSDYNKITDILLFENVPYIEAIKVLHQIIKNNCFPEK